MIKFDIICFCKTSDLVEAVHNNIARTYVIELNTSASSGPKCFNFRLNFNHNFTIIDLSFYFQKNQ